MGNLIVALALYVLLSLNKLTGKKLLSIILLIVAGVVGLLVLIQVLELGDFLRWRATAIQTYDAGRFKAQFFGIQMGLSYWIGVGPGQLDSLRMAPHSLYVRTFGEHGIVGFLALGLFISALLGRTWSTLLSNAPGAERMMPGKKVYGLSVNVVLAVAIGQLLNSLVIDTIHWRHLWFVFGLMWVVSTPQAIARRNSMQPTASATDVPRGSATVWSEHMNQTRTWTGWSGVFVALLLAASYLYLVPDGSSLPTTYTVQAQTPPSGTPPFYGMQYVPSEDLARVKELGIEVVLQDFYHDGTPAEWLAYLDAAHAQQIQVVAWFWPPGWT